MKKLDTKEAVHDWMINQIFEGDELNLLGEIAGDVLSDFWRQLEKIGYIPANLIRWHTIYIFCGIFNEDVFEINAVSALLNNIYLWFKMLDYKTNMLPADLFEVMIESSEKLEHVKIRFTSTTVRVWVPKAKTAKDGIYFDVTFLRTDEFRRSAGK